MPVIREGDTFPTLKDFKNALRQWAIEDNWTPHILDSDSHRVRAGCRSSKDCPFRIRVNFSDKRKNALVTTCDDVHNCHASRGEGATSHQNIKRAESGKLRFLMEAVPQLIEVTMATNVQEIIDAVEKKYGQRIPTRQAQKVKSGLAPKIREQCRHCQTPGHTERFCPKSEAVTTTPTAVSIDVAMDDTGDLASANQQHSNAGNHSDKALNHQIGNGDHTITRPAERDAERQPPKAARRARARGKESLPPIDPSLTSSYPTFRVIAQPGTEPDTSQASHQQRRPEPSQTLPPPAAPPPPLQSRSAAEIRTEAAKLMQSAAILMEKAAQMNAEAARLNLMVAND